MSGPALRHAIRQMKPAGTRARRCWGGIAVFCRGPEPARARWHACARAWQLGAPSPCAAPRAALRTAVLLRAAVGLSGESVVQVNLLNYRYDRTPFVNHLHIAPIRNSAGEVRPVGFAVPQQTALDRAGLPVALRPCRQCGSVARCHLQTKTMPWIAGRSVRAGGVPGWGSA